MKRKLALLLAALMLLGLLAGCGGAPAQTQAEETGVTPAETAPAEAPAAPAVTPDPNEYTLPREDGCRQLTLYWNGPTDNYDNCDVWMWFPGRDGHGELFHPCGYGAKVVVNVPQDVT